jgi:hypothetical protein
MQNNEKNENVDYTLYGKNAFYQLKNKVKEHDNPVLAIAYLKEDLSVLFDGEYQVD